MATETNQKETVSPTVQSVAPKNFELTAATAVLPLRLFLGLTFVAASLDKFTDPQFFNSSSIGYIGNQLAGFARNSPIGDFLTNVAVPNAMLFGLSVAIGQMAIGLGTLVGLFSRTAALFGTILSFTLWISSSWAVQPFYFGSDLPYMLGWLTLFVAGAHPMLSLDGQIQQWREKQKATQGIVSQPEPQIAGMARRHFIMVTGGTFVAGTATAVAWGNTLAGKEATPVASITPSAVPTATIAPASANTAVASVATPTVKSSAEVTSTPVVVSSSNTTAPNPTVAATKPANSTVTATANEVRGTVIAAATSIPMGEAKVFTTPDKSPAVLIHGDDNVFRAFSTVCTHQGCDVSYSKADNALICPCHGARFDVKTGAATRRPANSPLKSYAVQVANGNVVFVQQ